MASRALFVFKLTTCCISPMGSSCPTAGKLLHWPEDSHAWLLGRLLWELRSTEALLQSGREILPHLHESQSRLQLIHVSGTESEHLEDWALSKGVRWGRHRFQQWREPFTAYPQRLKRHHDWFMVVRHPVDRLKSESWRLQLKVEELLTSNMVRPLSEDVDASTVQHFVRYESLESDLSKLLESYDLSLLFGRLPKRDAKEPESTCLVESEVCFFIFFQVSHGPQEPTSFDRANDQRQIL